MLTREYNIWTVFEAAAGLSLRPFNETKILILIRDRISNTAERSSDWMRKDFVGQISETVYVLFNLHPTALFTFILQMKNP